jgi:hypothetical protein
MKRVRKAGQIQHLGFTSSSSHLEPDISTWTSTNVLEFSNKEENFVNMFHAYEISKLLLEYSIQAITALARDADGSYVPGYLPASLGIT